MTAYALIEAALDAALSDNSTITMLGPFVHTNGYIEAVKVLNIMLLPFIGLLLERYLSPVQTWSRLDITFVTVGLTKEYKPLLYWLHVALVRNGPHSPSPIFAPNSMMLVPEQDLFNHRHQVLVGYLPSFDKSLSCAQVLIITTTRA